MQIVKCGNYYKCKKFWRAQELAQQQSISLCSFNHRSENPEELLFHSGIETHHIEGTRETGFLRHFLCAVVILKHIPKCSFRKHVIFFFHADERKIMLILRADTA